MNTFIFPVVKLTRTNGYVAIRADSLDEAQAIELSQSQLAKEFQSTYSERFEYEKKKFNPIHQQFFGGHHEESKH